MADEKTKGSFLSNLGGSLLSGLGNSIIGTGMNIVGGLFSNHQQQKNARYWANYNSPINQMKRLKEAGLNPALVYGNGNAAATYDADTSVQSISGGQPNNRSLSPQEFKVLKSQANLQDSQAQSNYADKALKMSQKKQVDTATAGIELDNKRKFAADPVAMGEVDKKLRDAELEAKNISNKVNNELARIGVDKGYFLDNTFNGYVRDSISNMLLEVEYQYADAKARLQNGLLDSQQKLNFKQIERIEKELPYISAQMSAAYALAENYRSATNLNDKKALGQSLQNFMLFIDSYFSQRGFGKSGVVSDIARPLYRLIDEIKKTVGFEGNDWKLWNYYLDFERLDNKNSRKK